MGVRQVGWIAAVLLTVPFTAGRASHAEAQEREGGSIAVRTFDYYKLSARDLAAAQAAAARILGQAEVDVTWLDCRTERESGRPASSTAAECLRPLGPTDLVLRIASAEASGPRGSHVAMGFSFVNAKDGKAPYFATVYPNLAAAVARPAGVDTDELLGRAIAHELGHLLLGTNSHAPLGLMRAVWSQADLRRNRRDDWTFRPDEAEAMRKSIATRSALEPGTGGGS